MLQQTAFEFYWNTCCVTKLRKMSNNFRWNLLVIYKMIYIEKFHLTNRFEIFDGNYLLKIRNLKQWYIETRNNKYK